MAQDGKWWQQDQIVQPAGGAVPAAHGIPGFTKVIDSPDESAMDQRAEQRDIERLDIAQRGEDRTEAKTGFDQARDLRQEFEKMPEVENIKTIMPFYLTGLRSAPDPQGDIALTISFAKMLDPNSVVRQEEFNTIAETDSKAGAIIAKWRKELQGDGTYRPEVRERLRNQMIQQFDLVQQSYNSQRDRYAQIAEQFGVDPSTVTAINHVAPFADELREVAAERRGKGGAGAAAQRGGEGPGDIGFNYEPPPGFNDEQTAAWDSFWKANPNADVDQLKAFGNSIGVDIRNAEDIIAARDEGLGVQGGSTAVYQAPDMSEDRGEGGIEESGKAFVRGAGDVLTMGTSDKIQATLNTIFDGGTFESNLAYENAIDDYDEENNFGARLTGQLVGGLVLPVGRAKSAVDLAKVGAAYGGAYGAGSSDRLADIPGNLVAGTALGGVGGAGAAKAGDWIGKLAIRWGNGGPPQSATRAATAKGLGFEISPGEARGGTAAWAEKALEVSPGSSGRMEAARDARMAGAEKAADTVAGKYGEAGGYVSRGDAMQKGARRWMDRALGEAGNPANRGTVGKAYDRVPIRPESPAVTSATKGALGEMSEAISNPALAAAMRNPRLERFADAFAKAGDEPISWGDLKAFRSFIGNEIGESTLTDAPQKAQLQRLYGALSDDMRATAQARGPEALRLFERANDLNRRVQQRVENTIAKIVGKKDDMPAEKAAALMDRIASDNRGSADIKMLAELRSTLMKSDPETGRAAWDEVSSSLIRMMGQPLNQTERGFSPATFVTSFSKIAPDAKNIIFGQGALRKELDAFADVMKGMAQVQGKANSSNTAPIMNVILGIANVPLLGTQMGIANVMSRLWTSPKFVNWATGYAKMMRGAAKAGKPITAAAQKRHARLLEKVGAADPAIAQETLGLRNYLLAASNDNATATGRAMASPDEGPEQ